MIREKSGEDWEPHTASVDGSTHYVKRESIP